MASKALEINIACSRVDITIQKRYHILLKVMEKYHGVREGLKTFIEEVCHPYKNWEFIVKEARAYALNYFHVLKGHALGPDGAGLYVDIFMEAIHASQDTEVKRSAADNLLLFVQKIIYESDSDFERFVPVLSDAFDRIGCQTDEIFSLFVESFYQLSKLGKGLAQKDLTRDQLAPITSLLVKYYRFTYDYWQTQGDPRSWFEQEAGPLPEDNGLAGLFEPISLETLGRHQEELDQIVPYAQEDPGDALNRLVHLPGYARIVSAYHGIPHKLRLAGDAHGQGNQWKLIFLLHIMNLSGLSAIHEDALRDINRTLVRLIQNEDPQVIRQSLEKTFDILRLSATKYPETALNCVLNMGKAVYKTDDSDLVDVFIDSVVSLGFQSPQMKGVGNDWQVQANPAHIQNIRTWLELVELNPKWSKKLLSSLIIHLSFSGVFIKDTDLFPRDITGFLNSDIGPVYNLAKQLTRLFPAYFNDIGAEGRLRDISTRIDEICLRKDPLIHFLRKQSHVESSNRIVGLMEATLDFWMTRQKEEVEPFVPPNIYGEIETEGPYVEGVHRVMTRLVQDQDLGGIKDLLQIETHDLRTLIGEVPGASDPDFERIDLAVSLYKLLYQKYDMGFVEMEGYLSRLQSAGFQDLDRLRDALSETDVPQKLSKLLAYLEELKAVVLSPRAYEIREDIYRKRHFTVDIPSMYGSYHERKFDALGLTFRLESVANVLFEELTHTIDLNLITRATFSQIHHYLRLFDRALKLDGITSLEMERQLDLFAHSLEIRGFSSTQYLDIFRGFSQAVSNIVNDFFDNIHQDNLFKILHQMPKGTLLPKYGVAGIEVDPDRLPHRVAEIFLRDRIATSLGLQQLDIFLARILNTLNQQADELPGERQHQLLSYDPQKALTPISPAKQEVNDIIHLGNKGLNLVKMTGLGMPVPPGFIITTEAFRFRDIIDHYEPAKRNFQEHVALEIKALEAATGRSLGDPRNPLLLSTRSGSSISQPGMMSTFLDVGINEEIVQGLIALTGNEWFGWDTYRRFLQSYGMAFGLIRDDFDAIINQFKERLGHLFKKDFSGEQMKEVALAYKSFISEAGIDIQESPFQQLLVAIQKVFESWFASKAQAYRKIMGISDEWGTAVTVQSMVFGNFSPSSGAGVFFTHSPRWKGDMLIPWGDFTLGNQGEDVVSGLVRTLPISGRQAEMENRARDTTLESLFPEIYQSLRQWAKALIYDRKWSPQEMEFTFEGARQKDLYFLQTRDMSMRQRKTVYSFDMTSRASHEFLGHGIGVSGGAMTGRVVFSLEEIRQWRKAEPHTSLILVRGDTVPDDIMEIYEADGLLTARGGSTSHAAIVAHRLDKTCVVGFPNLLCMEKDRTCSLSQRVLKTGDRISMDGRDGAVFLGAMQVKEVESG